MMHFHSLLVYSFKKGTILEVCLVRKAFIFITIISIVILIMGVYDWLYNSGYRFTLNSAIYYGLNNIHQVYDAKTQITYKIDNNTYIVLVADSNDVGVVSVKRATFGLFYKYNSSSFGNKNLRISTDISLIVNHHGKGERKTGFYVMGLKINSASPIIPYDKLKPSLYIIQSPYALAIWYNGDEPPLSLFTEPIYLP